MQKVALIFSNPTIYSDQADLPTTSSRAVSLYQSGLQFVSKSLLRISNKRILLACIIWKSKDTANLRPGYWSKSSKVTIRTWPHSFHLLALLSIYWQAPGSHSILSATPEFKACLFLNSSNKKLTLSCADRKMCLSLNHHCCQRNGLHWLANPELCAHPCVGVGPIPLPGMAFLLISASPNPSYNLSAPKSLSWFLLRFSLFTGSSNSFPNKYFPFSKDLPFKTNRRGKPQKNAAWWILIMSSYKWYG